MTFLAVPFHDYILEAPHSENAARVAAAAQKVLQFTDHQTLPLLIMASHYPHQAEPRDPMEAVLQDADLLHAGLRPRRPALPNRAAR